MKLLTDLFSLLAGCVAMFAAMDRKGLYAALALGLMLAVVCWLACSYYSKLWNKRYQVRFVHHILCCVAALLTLGFVVVYAALKYTKEAAYASVLLWEAQINFDSRWAKETFVTAYERVKKLGVEDFSKVPPPTAPNSFIPTNNDVSIFAAASIYAASAAAHFNGARPFLSLMLKGQTDVPTKVLDADVKNYFATVSHTYPTQKAVSMVASEVKKGLDAQVPRVVVIARRISIGGFAFVQFIPFGLVGIAAYKNLKVRM